MTVCLGAVCANTEGHEAKAVVVASDRMVTLMGLTQFEHDVPKVSAITDRISALIAGDALRGSRLVRELRASLPSGGTATVEQVANAAGALYSQHRHQQIETEVFAPRGITHQQYYGGLQMLPQIAGSIDQYMVNFNFGTDFLIAGTDDAGAHLFYVGNPGGMANDFQMIGFHAIGSGMLHALQSLIGFGQAPTRGLYETVFAVYASKRRAEVAPGVGKDTDMVVIEGAQSTRLDQAALSQLEEIYQEVQKPVSDELRERMSALQFTNGGNA